MYSRPRSWPPCEFESSPDCGSQPGQETQTRTSSNLSSKESNKGRRYRRTCLYTCSSNRQNRSKKPSEWDSAMSMSDAYCRSKALPNRPIKCLGLFRYSPDHSLEEAHTESYKKYLALKVIGSVYNRYRKALDLRTYRLASTSSVYDYQRAWNVLKWAKCLQIQLRTSIIDPFDPSSL